MSRETLTWLNTMTLIGHTDKRGKAWHYKASEQGAEPNHYPQAIPVEDVERRLFHWEALEGSVSATVLHPDGVLTVTDADRKAIVRPPHTFGEQDKGDILGIFKGGYTIHSYREWLLHTVADILDDDLSIGSAGLLRGGAQAWVSVEVPENITTPSGVEFRPNLLAVTSLDGSLATSYRKCVTNVVCDNTMAAALTEQGQTFKLKHTRNSGMRLLDAREALQVVHTISDTFASEVEQLTNTTVTDAQWDDFLARLCTLDDKGNEKTGRGLTMGTNKREDIDTLYRTDDRVSPWNGTAWGVVQAINTWSHHMQGKNKTAGQRAETNMQRAVKGDVETLDQGTLALLQQVM